MYILGQLNKLTYLALITNTIETNVGSLTQLLTNVFFVVAAQIMGSACNVQITFWLLAGILTIQV